MYTRISKFVIIKRTMCLFNHIFSMYTHILTIKRNYVNNKTHIFYVYSHFKICNNKKNYVSFYSHIFYVYLYFNYKKKLCE